ncbi:MAG: aminopeptidase P family N-terminal domain-containing protein, partial [Armatimonadetes bacterium]|nr:aminopeptidase P family N-terminal domain-containing protein [Armatimonadota bacterium]
MDVIISRDEIFRRLERLIAAAADRGLRGVLAVARPFFERPANVAYLSNHFPPFPTAMFWGEAQGFGHAAVVIPTHGEPVLLVDTTYRQDLVPIRDVRRAVGPSGLPHLAAAIADVLREKGLEHGRIGLVGDDLMPVRMYRDLTTRLPGLVLEPFDDVLARLRMVKS